MITNPLLIPEILDRVSDFVPSWKFVSCHRTPSEFEFYPHDTLACALVCRTWYTIFYPTLWSVYDGRAMSRIPPSPRGHPGQDNDVSNASRNISFASVPKNLLTLQSPRFRIFVDNGPRQISDIASFQCRQLMDLTLYGSFPRSRHLLSMNPHLKKLTWYGEVPFSGMLSDLDVDALLALAKRNGRGVQVRGRKCMGLEELHLNQWDVSEGRLIRVLQGLSKGLVRLTLKNIQGLDSLSLSREMATTGGKVLNEVENEGDEHEDEEVKEVIERGQNNSDPEQWTMQRPTHPHHHHHHQQQQQQQEEEQEQEQEQEKLQRKGLVLDHLQELTIDCEWVENQALLEFITECCPKLTSLHLSDALMDDQAMMDSLEDTLAARRGRLQKTMTSGGIQYRLDANGDIMACYTE